MKITYESYGRKYSIELDHDDVTLDELVPLIRHLLLSAGFHQSSIQQYFIEEE